MISLRRVDYPVELERQQSPIGSDEPQTLPERSEKDSPRLECCELGDRDPRLGDDDRLAGLRLSLDNAGPGNG